MAAMFPGLARRGSVDDEGLVASIVTRTVRWCGCQCCVVDAGLGENFTSTRWPMRSGVDGG
jgi:hypothetical protein